MGDEMEQLVTVRAMRERYGCSMPTARKYLRECHPHMENPLTAPEWAVQEWEDSRTVLPVKVSRRVQIGQRTERVKIPRNW